MNESSFRGDFSQSLYCIFLELVESFAPLTTGQPAPNQEATSARGQGGGEKGDCSHVQALM